MLNIENNKHQRALEHNLIDGPWAIEINASTSEVDCMMLTKLALHR
jgi:hypothetical protein